MNELTAVLDHYDDLFVGKRVMVFRHGREEGVAMIVRFCEQPFLWKLRYMHRATYHARCIVRFESDAREFERMIAIENIIFDR